MGIPFSRPTAETVSNNGSTPTNEQNDTLSETSSTQSEASRANDQLLAQLEEIWIRVADGQANRLLSRFVDALAHQTGLDDGVVAKIEQMVDRKIIEGHAMLTAQLEVLMSRQVNEANDRLAVKFEEQLKRKTEKAATGAHGGNNDDINPETEKADHEDDTIKVTLTMDKKADGTFGKIDTRLDDLLCRKPGAASDHLYVQLGMFMSLQTTSNIQGLLQYPIFDDIMAAEITIPADFWSEIREILEKEHVDTNSEMRHHKDSLESQAKEMYCLKYECLKAKFTYTCSYIRGRHADKENLRSTYSGLHDLWQRLRDFMLGQAEDLCAMARMQEKHELAELIVKASQQRGKALDKDKASLVQQAKDDGILLGNTNAREASG